MVSNIADTFAGAPTVPLCNIQFGSTLLADPKPGNVLLYTITLVLLITASNADIVTSDGAGSLSLRPLAPSTIIPEPAI